MATIDQILREQATQAPTAALAVVVTVEPGMNSDSLTSAGLVVVRRIERINIVCGTLRGADIERVADLPGVVRIEADSPMRTF